jgi:SAM-dependent methyltransferase
LGGLIVFEVVLGLLTGRVAPFLTAPFIAAVAASYLYTTRRGKFVVWAGLLDRLGLRGDERVLDLGCGRGAVLLMAAQRLTTGRAVGVDLWRSVDQSGNAAEATRRNAVAEGVADRVELHTADMTALPFAGESFDLVVSSLAIHNISGAAGREKALREAVRVLRPGGRLVIADVFWAARQYPAQLAGLGITGGVRRWLGWRFWGAFLVTATKPEVPGTGGVSGSAELVQAEPPAAADPARGSASGSS